MRDIESVKTTMNTQLDTGKVDSQLDPILNQ